MSLTAIAPSRHSVFIALITVSLSEWPPLASSSWRAKVIQPLGHLVPRGGICSRGWCCHLLFPGLVGLVMTA